MVWRSYFTGDQLAIGKETGRRLGMGTNMYPSSSLLGQHKDESLAALPVDELIEKADGFAGVFPGHYLFWGSSFIFDPAGVILHVLQVHGLVSCISAHVMFICSTIFYGFFLFLK